MILPRHVRSGRMPEELLRAARRRAKSRDHLVEDEQRVLAIAQRAQALEEPGLRRHDAHVAGDRLDEDRGNLLRGSARRAASTDARSL